MKNRYLSYILFGLIAANMSWNFSLDNKTSSIDMASTASTDAIVRYDGRTIKATRQDNKTYTEIGGSVEHTEASYKITSVEGIACECLVDQIIKITQTGEPSKQEFIDQVEAIIAAANVEKAEKERKEREEAAKQARLEREKREEECKQRNLEDRVDCMNTKLEDFPGIIEDLEDELSTIDYDLDDDRLSSEERNRLTQRKREIEKRIKRLETLTEKFIDEVAKETEKFARSMRNEYVEVERLRLELLPLNAESQRLEQELQQLNRQQYWGNPQMQAQKQQKIAEIRQQQARIKSDTSRLKSSMSRYENRLKERSSEYKDFKDLISARALENTVRSIEQVERDKRSQVDNAIYWQQNAANHEALKDNPSHPMYLQSLIARNNFQYQIIDWQATAVDRYKPLINEDNRGGLREAYVEDALGDFEKLLQELGLSGVLNNVDPQGLQDYRTTLPGYTPTRNRLN